MHIEWHCSILNLLALMTMTLLDNSSVYGYRISIVLSIITHTTSVCPVVPVFPLLIFPLFQYHLYMPMQGTATHSRAQSRSMAIFISCPIIGAEPEHTGMKVNVLSKRSTQKLHYKCSLQPAAWASRASNMSTSAGYRIPIEQATGITRGEDSRSWAKSICFEQEIPPLSLFLLLTCFYLYCFKKPIYLCCFRKPT